MKVRLGKDLAPGCQGAGARVPVLCLWGRSFCFLWLQRGKMGLLLLSGDIVHECVRQGVKGAEFCLVGWNWGGQDRKSVV